MLVTIFMPRPGDAFYSCETGMVVSYIQSSSGETYLYIDEWSFDRRFSRVLMGDRIVAVRTGLLVQSEALDI